MPLETKQNNIGDTNLGMKVKGDLGDFQIEEISDSEDDLNGDRSSRSLSTIPAGVVQPSSSSAPVFGSVSVKDSENVQFGNNTYFNGPVTIKQVVQNIAGVDNASYAKTEEEDIPRPKFKQESKSDDSTTKKFEIQTWHKLTFSAICIIILGGICAIVSIILSKTSKDDTSTNFSEDDSSNCTEVVGLYHRNYQIISIVITIILLPLLLLLMSYSLLTKETISGDKRTSYGASAKSKTMRNALINNDCGLKYNVKADPLLIAPNHLRIVSRSDWLAQPAEGILDVIRQPVPWVIITHTATESCSSQSECVLRVRYIQMFHIESKKWFDIGYNFLVAGDGSAYYGRGWDHIGAHTLGYNKYSIGIAFIGTFNKEAPPKKQLEACEKLIKRGVELGKIAKDYKLFAHRQLASTLSPGDRLFDIIKEWPHFVKNFTDISELLPNY